MRPTEGGCSGARKKGAARRLLFLLGGAKILDEVAEAFVPAAGGKRSRIALLLMGGPDWEKHLPRFADPWRRRGVTSYATVVPGDDGALDGEAAAAAVREASGIFIAGGDTRAYHRLYATEPMRSAIRARYEEGVPVAGLSAGALIAPEVCAIRLGDFDDASVEIVPGLGLVRDLVVGVHFTERKALPRMLEAMGRTKTRLGLGMDESACVVLEEGRLKRVIGKPAYRVVMTDFEAKRYEVRQLA